MRSLIRRGSSYLGEVVLKGGKGGGRLGLETTGLSQAKTLLGRYNLKRCKAVLNLVRYKDRDLHFYTGRGASLQT